MAQVLVATKGMDKSEWLEWRKKGIGGSDAAAIAGLNPWKSPIEIYLEKIGDIGPSEPGEAAYWGNILEAIVADEFERRTNLKLRRCNAILQHPLYPFMLGNIDRLIVGQKVGLECKTTSAYSKDAWDGDNVPDAYILQCQHYMAVTGYKAWWIACLIGGNKFIYKLIERDEDIINYLIKLEGDFWRRVQEKDPPPMDGSNSSSEVLKMLYPESVPDTSVELPQDAKDLISAYLKAQKSEKEYAEKKEEYANKLKALLEDSEVGILPDNSFKVTWKTINSSRFDSKRFKADCPDIYKKYLNSSSYRKFDIKKIGGK